MPTASFTAELAEHGPGQSRPERPKLDDARRYCRRLARRHYENFTVASWLLPAQLRPHFHAIYAYCRWADDLADETGDPAESLRLLDWWQQQLDACYRGQAEHPVFVALMDTIRQFEIPTAPLADLLTAFRQDQRVTRYESVEQLLDYCRNSANPVGRLVLHLGHCCTPANAELSDSVCTGLQLANFWQDVACDYDRGRIYLPAEVYRAHGYDEEMFARREYNPAFRAALQSEVGRAETYLNRGWPLVDRMPTNLRVDVAMFIQGGLKILEHIRRQNFDVWSRRPEVTKWEQAKLLAGCWWRYRWHTAGGVR